MEEAIKEIQQQVKEAKITGFPLDLADFESIDSFVSNVEKLKVPIHFLVNNAGVMATPKRTTKQGHEYQFGINHIGHFRLTMKLLPILISSVSEKEPGRIVHLSSAGHQIGTKKINFEDINWENEGAYGPWYAYGQSKLANIVFSNDLDRRLVENKIPIRSFALHPGGISTELGRDMDGFTSSVMNVLAIPFFKSIPQGAATTVYAVTHPELNEKGGLYLEDCNISKALDYAYDVEEQKKLYDYSVKEAGVSFPK
jgi:NAD(P)-dependent dehydrogenase (short-subunit alcohol dehydrogenase family)